MNELQKFSFKGNGIRVVTKGDEPWFVAKDVCEVLEISKHRDAVSRLDEDERRPVLVDALAGKQEMTAVSEAGLYSLILKSRKPEAKAFKRWITHEVLPSIRKTGGYSVDEEKMLLLAKGCIAGQKMVEHLTAERDQLQDQCNNMAKEIEALRKSKPGSSLHYFQPSNEDVLIRDFAYEMSKFYDEDLNQKKMFDFLRDMGWLSETRYPTEKADKLEIFSVHHYSIKLKGGKYMVAHTTRITPKGQRFLADVLAKKLLGIDIHQYHAI